MQLRLNELNQERNVLLRLLDIKEKVSPRDVMSGVKKIKGKKNKRGGKKWSPEQRAKFKATMKAKYGVGK
jgi:hypothetical protein